MDNICDYDEGYNRSDAYEIGWCYECRCNPKCPYKRKSIQDMFAIMGNPLILKRALSLR